MTRQSIVDLAIAELGTGERPANSNKTKYGDWYGLNGFAWCAMFVSYIFDKAGLPLGKIDNAKGYCGCQSGYNYWKSKGQLTMTPQPADIVLFDWKGNGHCDHTGIFKKWLVLGETFVSIEGNTAVGNDRDGGCVMERTRNVRNVKAFASPAVLGGTVVPMPSEIAEGAKGSKIAEIQKMLYDLDYVIVVDGEFGPKTKAVITKFQNDNSLTADGKITPALQRILELANQKKETPDSKITNGSFLKKGSSGAAVLEMQRAINKKMGNGAVAEDGVFGSRTVEAVKKFQQQNNLTADGVAGPQTFEALGIEI